MIYLLRHGLDDENFIGGWSDVDLTKEGIKQVEEVTKYIKKLKFDTILCSDIKRATTTASIVNKQLNKKVIYTKELREQDKGILTGMKKEDAYKNYPYLFDNVTIKTVYPNGESLEDLYNRIKIYLEKLLKMDNVLCITHRGVINMIYFILNDINPDMNKEKFNVDHASLHEIDVIKKQIKKLN